MNRRIEVCTVCGGRVLNALCRQGVSVDKVCRCGRRLSFVVSGRQYAAASDALRQMGMSFTSRRVGIGALFFSLRRRPVLVVAVLVACLALVVATQAVWAVRVQCPPSLQAAVDEVIGQTVYPVWRRDVDVEALRGRISALDGVALSSVYVRGVYLCVEVKEELPEGEIESPVGPIVAECDCVISRVVVERGRAMVQEGQSVRRGDVLIAPEYLIDADADVTVPTTAVGQVYGYVYPTYTYQHREHDFVSRRTGNARRTAVLSFAGQTFGQIETSPYATYDEVVEHVELGCVLPISVERVTYYETAMEEQFAPWSVAKEEVLQFCYAQIEAQLKKDVQIRRKWCIIDTMGSIHRVRAYAEVEQTVGVYYEME